MQSRLLPFTFTGLRRCACLVVLLCSAVLGIQAQNMSVKSFEQRPEDLTATLKDTKRTARQDGRTAAIIKIVTREKDFTFDVGSISLVGDPVYNPGEIWIYLPARTQKITISHPRYGQLRDYFFPVPIESGKTYLMVLDPGVGRYTTINTTTPRSIVYLDGDSIGLSPIVNHYILYGKHHLSARNDRMEGETDIELVNDGRSLDANFTIPMVDQSEHFGMLTITTDPEASIIFDGKVRGVGIWTTELREGHYYVETEKLNADNSRTAFTIKPKEVNMVAATPPVPHMGYINLYTRPRDAEMSIDGKTVATNDSTYELPVGNHTVNLTRKNFISAEREYVISHNATMRDTIDMERIQFFHKNSFYLGASYVFGSFSGVNFTAGGTYKNIDLQLSFMLGLSKTGIYNYYQNVGEGNTTPYVGQSAYSLNVFSAKLGYQIPLETHFCIVPQLGYAAHLLSSKDSDGTVPSQSANAACMTVGAKLMYSPIQHFSLMLAPEYDIALSKGSQYQSLVDAGALSAGGFFCHIGVILNF